jgi:CheY-like chemotaxis protein
MSLTKHIFGKKVIIVDDCVLFTEAIGIWIQKFDIDFKSFTLVNKFLENKELIKECDAIILDYYLGYGITAPDVIREIRKMEAYQRTPILFLTTESQTEKKMEAMVSLGVPYTEEDISKAQASMLEQGTQIEKNLYSDPDFVESYEADKAAGGEDFIEMRNREIVAIIAYLQRLGTDIKVKDTDNQTAQN